MIPKPTSEPGALDTAAMIRAGEMSPLEAVDEAIARIEALDEPVNAVVVRVPMTIKESFNIAGLPTTWGLAEHRDFVAREDAAVVTRLKRAGAIFLGKTNVPPLLSDWQANNPNYGRTSNPHDLSRSPGGSSGGSAAALAAGMVPAEYGSDIAGSIRVPAHFCGVWGHKPSWGAVDGAGHSFPGTDGHGVALGVVGPLARNGADLAALLELTLERPQARSDKPLGECRFLLVEQHTLVPTDSGVAAVVAAAASAVERAGARVDRDSELLPDLAAQHAAYFPMLITAMNPYGPNPRTGEPMLLADWYGFLDAQARFRRAWARLFERYDFVLAPPFATPAFPHEDRAPAERTLTIDGEAYPAELGMAWPGMATFPELPATVLPAGESGGLPVGLQVIGARWRDRDCIATATRIAELLAA
jgi:amidase